ncbi:hypothetical protein [Agromyces sp. CCNWLW203]|uniref:hypothetical protein n=1 Tax=Agromyces sp. CCNWLW203 TaxID=3112842 RepID=UPI002F96A506
MSTAHRQLPDDDPNRLQLVAAWSAVRRSLSEAIRDLEKLDDAIRTASAAGISEMGIVIESRSEATHIETRLVREVVAGGTSLGYYVSKYDRLQPPAAP